MKKSILTTAAAVMILAGAAFAQAPRFEISVLGGLTRVFAYGSEADYVMGSNDFPVTPAHAPAWAGAGFALALSSSLKVELRGEYVLGADLALADPSDGDTVTVPSAKHLAVSLNLRWSPLGGRFRPYLIAGGGLDKVLAETGTYLSTYGYQITFEAPARTIDPFVAAGAGLEWSAFGAFGLFVEARGRMVFAKPDSIKSLDAAAGVRIRL